MNTLIITDVQNDFMAAGALEVPDAQSILSPLNQVQSAFDLVIATQDWHPYNHKSFASNHSNKQPFETIQLNGLQQVLWPDHCVQGTKGAEFHPQLDMTHVCTIFRKGMDPEIDSYSGFYDNNHRNSTGLAGYLNEKKVKNIYFAGLASDYCVYFTIQDALKHGYTCFFLEDASRAIDIQRFEELKQKLIAQGVKIIKTSEII